MQDQNETKDRLKELIDSIEARVTASGKPFYFLSLRLTRVLTLEEENLFHNFLRLQYPKAGRLSLLAPQVEGYEIHLLPDVSESKPPHQTSGTLGAVLRLSQSIVRDFGIAPAKFNESITPFNECIGDKK